MTKRLLKYDDDCGARHLFYYFSNRIYSSQFLCLIIIFLPQIIESTVSKKSTFREIIYESNNGANYTWPHRDQVATIDGNVTIGGLMMVHERDEQMICGKIMPQGGLQATEAMLYTVNKINDMKLLPGIQLAARIKDDCDRDIYGLEQSVDFIRGKCEIIANVCVVMLLMH